MNLRPSGYEPDELPGCSTPRFVRDLELAGWRRDARVILRNSVFIDGKFSGADDREAEEDHGEFEGIGIFIEALISGGDEAESGDEHGEGKKKANRAIKGTEDKENPADAFGEGGKKAPEFGKKIDAEELHFGAENFPQFGASGQLGKTMGDEGGAEADANKEEARVAIFSEEFKEHRE